jgi:Flp pilus assembly protein TadG
MSRCPPAQNRPSRDGLAARIARHHGRFRRDEDGSLIVFGLFLFLLMLMMGGMAVDLMRYEQRRTALQQTIDRSVLAAASLTQDLDPETVVRDYFEKAQLLQHLTNVRVTEGLNFRIVEAQADAELLPFFTPMVGIDDFQVPADSAAEQRITNVEVVMVLDISGSMNSNNRAVNLKIAAKDFVQTVLANDAEHRIGISMVPYNGQVNLGPQLVSRFNVTNHSGAANVDCVDMPASVYETETHSRTLAMPATAHADTYSSTTQSTSYVAIQGHTINGSGLQSNNWCPQLPDNIIRVMGTNATTLMAQIDALDVIGATSINAGMRWGLNLIDPAQRPLITELVGAGQVHAGFAGRPFDWDDEEAMKVIIVMSDGEHFPEDRVNTAYKSGQAPIWYSAADNAFLIRHTTGRPATAGTNEYWLAHGNSGAGQWLASVPAGYTQQSWPQVWSRARMKWVAWQLYARALGTSSTTRTDTYNLWMSNFRAQTATTAMDTQLNQVCDFAKNRGVIVYSIAFEAPANGQAALQNCASSPAHYYNATGLQIQSAFKSIASNISQLRLTQ